MSVTDPVLAAEIRALLARAGEHSDNCTAVYCGWECEGGQIADDAIGLLRQVAG